MSSDEKPPRGRILQLVREMPGDRSYDEILRELAFVRRVDRGLADADEGRLIETPELRQRMRAWQR